jgi:medium-chain acyl-[acyl-carrier-protein] hydrolase
MNGTNHTQHQFTRPFELESSIPLLFCFPYGGGGTWIFRNWPRGLAGVAEVHPVSLPGHGSDITVPPVTSMKILIGQLAPFFAEVRGRPFGFCGHSMGAIIAFELAIALRRAGGSQPSLLAVTGQRAPHRMKQPTLRFYDLPDPLLKSVLRHHVPQITGLKDPEFSDIYLPLIRADFAISQGYRFEPDAPLDCTLLACGGSEDVISQSELDGWRLHTTGRSEVRMLPGDHFFIHTQEELFLNTLRAVIRNAG